MFPCSAACATFVAKLLHAIFAKQREPQRRGFGNRLGREGLRDSHQLDLAARTPGRSAGRGDRVLQPFEIFLERRHLLPQS